MADKQNKINLTFPIDGAYVSAARLTASSIANRMGFDIDEIEDIKTAVSEASTFIIKHYAGKVKKDLQITFSMQEKSMNILIIVADAPEIKAADDDMSLVMISALMDNFEMKHNDERLSIKMIKNHIDSVIL